MSALTRKNKYLPCKTNDSLFHQEATDLLMYLCSCVFLSFFFYYIFHSFSFLGKFCLICAIFEIIHYMLGCPLPKLPSYFLFWSTHSSLPLSPTFPDTVLFFSFSVSILHSLVHEILVPCLHVSCAFLFPFGPVYCYALTSSFHFDNHLCTMVASLLLILSCIPFYVLFTSFPASFYLC